MGHPKLKVKGRATRPTAETTSTYSTSPTNCWAESYTYDVWANMTGITAITGSYTGCVQESGLSITVGTNNRITTSGFTYDNAGNMTAGSGSSYSYDAESQMTQSSVSSTAGYKYDGDGRRAEKTISATAYKLYWYDLGGNALEETDGAGNTSNSSFKEYMFFAGKRIARRDSSSNIVYMFADQLGSARVVTNSSGTIQDDSDFYAFGGERVVSSASGNVYKFEGKERDAESGLDDFGARYYSSQYGRFVSADWSAIPVAVPYADLTNPQTLNLYAMVHDNPETFADLDGHSGGDADQASYNPDSEQQQQERAEREKERAKEVQNTNAQHAQNLQAMKEHADALLAKADPSATEAGRQNALSQGVTGAEAGVNAGLKVEGAGLAIVTGTAAAPAVVATASTVITTTQTIAATVVTTAVTAMQSVGARIENSIPGGIQTLQEVQSFVGGYTHSNPSNSPPSIGGTLGRVLDFYEVNIKPRL